MFQRVAPLAYKREKLLDRVLNSSLCLIERFLWTQFPCPNLLENQIQLFVPIRVRRYVHTTGANLQRLIHHFPAGAGGKHRVCRRDQIGRLCLRITCP